VKLGRAFYERDTRTVARELLGKVLVHLDGGVRRAARIVETEAYHGPSDRASHARFGPTPRAAVMFGPPGRAYVYLVYGTSHCMNVVTGPVGFPAAVLVRAAEPLQGCLHATRGPGNLCRALAISRDHTGVDLRGPVLFVEDAPAPVERIHTGPRVNVDHAGPWAEKPWRYALAGSPHVSAPRLSPARDGPRRLTPPRRRRSRGSAPSAAARRVRR
jgi:DNA-3-methyladenine glycosylase